MGAQNTKHQTHEGAIVSIEGIPGRICIIPLDYARALAKSQGLPESVLLEDTRQIKVDREHARLLGCLEAEEDINMLTKKGTQYSAEWLKRNRGGYTYSVDYAPTGRALCAESKTRIKKGELRVSRLSPNPWDAEGGMTKFAKHFHVDHAWVAFLRSSCKSKVPLEAFDLEGFEKLTSPDQAKIKSMLSIFRRKWEKKCNISKHDTSVKETR